MNRRKRALDLLTTLENTGRLSKDESGEIVQGFWSAEEKGYSDGVQYALYELCKEIGVGSEDIRKSDDTTDGICARLAERIKAFFTDETAVQQAKSVFIFQLTPMLRPADMRMIRKRLEMQIQAGLVILDPMVKYIGREILVDGEEMEVVIKRKKQEDAGHDE